MVTMVLTNQNACEILGLPLGADISSIVQRYKQLALQWHPEKHKHSPESEKKFKQVSLAYKSLTTPSFRQDLNMNECLLLFQQIFFKGAANGTNYEDSDSSNDTDEDDDEDDDSDDSYVDGVTNNQSNKTDISLFTKAPETYTKGLTEDEREKERRRVEKRRAKKKRQRERKRLEKEQKTSTTSKPRSEKKGQNGSEKDSLMEDDTLFDPTSAFFTKVVSKKKKVIQGEEQQSLAGRRDKTGDKKSDDETEEMIDPKVLRSRQLAIRGNEMAQVAQYTAAIQLFTEAISLDSTDFRFFGNRSYCYDRIEQYDKALRDAEKAIKLDKDWPKGYFRKGRALAGLNMFPDAEKSFLKVLELDKNCDDAVHELFRVRTHQLMDMGFSLSQSETAIKKYGSVQAAMDSLLAGVGEHCVGDLHISDEDERLSFHRPNIVAPSMSSTTDAKMDPSNPEGLTALWVGNVLPSVSDKRLYQLFSKYGPVTSVRLLPEKFCAFINFKTKEAAGRAMHHLQGTEIEGQKLLIKFPDNPLNNTTTGSYTIRKPVTNTASKPGAVRAAAAAAAAKQTGPVNGDECYFWRTTGCTFGSDCKWQHYPKSKGIDRKPWQKSPKS